MSPFLSPHILLLNFFALFVKGQVWSICLSHDDQWVLSGSVGGGDAYFWDMHNSKRQCVLQVPQNSASLVACSPVGDYLTVGTTDGQVMVCTYRRMI